MNITTQQSGKRPLRWLALGLIAILVMLLLSGCGGSPTASAKPLPAAESQALGQQLVDIEAMSTAERDALADKLASEVERLAPNKKEAVNAAQLGRDNFLLGYLYEFAYNTTTRDADKRELRLNMLASYKAATETPSSYAPMATYRLGILAAHGITEDTNANPNTVAKTKLREVTMVKLPQSIWLRGEPVAQTPDQLVPNELAGEGGPATLANETTSGPVLRLAENPLIAIKRLDVIYRKEGGLDTAYYRIVDGIVSTFNRLSPAYGVVLALFFISLLVKLITMPFTAWQYRGMRDMQRVQPLLKELQEKYKDDKAKQAEEQMRIMKEHKVNPVGGCLPLLIQLPVFIAVYQAVQVYAYGFSQTGFLWIKNLALPDLILLILYAASMIVTQKLTTMPTADPQQQAIQNQMTYMMPLILVFVLQTIASAFLLYWFFLNVLSAVHQYYMMRQFKLEDAAAGALVPAVETPAPPADDTVSRRRKKGKSS